MRSDGSSDVQLAQVNIARLVAPLDDPRLADFVANLDAINAVAEASDGFVWRLTGDGNDATSLRVFPDTSVIVNMSVWRDREALRSFVYRSDHAAFLRRRREFFVPMTDAAMAMWHIPAGHVPTLGECQARLEHLDRHGTDAFAFWFRDEPPTLTIREVSPNDAAALALLGTEQSERAVQLAEADVVFIVRVDGEDVACAVVHQHTDDRSQIGPAIAITTRPGTCYTRLDLAMLSHLSGIARDRGDGPLLDVVGGGRASLLPRGAR